MPSPVQPLDQAKRHRADYRDEIEHAEAAAVLSELPDDHPARAAYLSGELSDSLQLSRRLTDRMDLVERLKEAYLAHSNRIWKNSMHTSDIGTQPARRA